MTVFYKKQGRRYIPVSEYDQELNDAIREGTHLIISTPGKLTRRYNVDPSFAPMIAAGIIAEDAISDVIMKALSFTPERPPVTPEQKAAWEQMVEAWGDELCRLQSGSILEAIRAGIDEMVRHSAELLENPALKQSYDNFILLSKLTRGV